MVSVVWQQEQQKVPGGMLFLYGYLVEIVKGKGRRVFLGMEAADMEETVAMWRPPGCP